MPKIKFEKEVLIEKVLEIAKEEGFENVTVRKIAQKIGSSVAPIYTAFGSVSEGIIEAKKLAIKKVSEATEVPYTENVFLNIGVGLLVFARDNKRLYKELFMTNPDDDMIKEFHESSLKKMGQTDMVNYFSYDEMKVLHMKMWIFTQGLATMICSDHLEDYSTEFFIQAQHEVGEEIMIASLLQKGLLEDYKKECDGYEISSTRWNIW